MIKYNIKEINSFELIGLEVEVPNSKIESIKVTKSFWKKFNLLLKNEKLNQNSGNWVKYAFMKRIENSLYYFISIPKINSFPDSFKHRLITTNKYLVVEHIGSIDNILNTYDIIYKEIIPKNNYILNQKDFLHFEKYDYHFNWSQNSIIEIWIPIE